MAKALIALEDGFVLEGESFGAIGEKAGEVVFNTSMAGYQEVLTDPSYRGQIVTMTYPLIGNYGVNASDVESRKVQVDGFIVRELCEVPSNYRSAKTLRSYLEESGVAGIQGVDTRALTKHIRLQGAMKGVISSADLDRKRLVQKAKDSPGLVGRDLVKEVACKELYTWPLEGYETDGPSSGSGTGRGYRVVTLDCGVKFNILRMLARSGCDVTVVPAQSTADEILALKPDGVCLSNGPGDPAAVSYVIETTRSLIGKVPIFGICLGHQMLGLAFGGKTYKLKFGHRGVNHPVKDMRTGKIAITSQNHGFCVDPKTLNKDEIETTHINLNDGTSEGMRHKGYPIFSVQYHPEASPGPHDSYGLFEEFIETMKNPQS